MQPYFLYSRHTHTLYNAPRFFIFTWWLAYLYKTVQRQINNALCIYHNRSSGMCIYIYIYM